MLTQERLKELLHYDPETGSFTSRLSRGKIKVGQVVGHLEGSGYIRIGLDSTKERAHRLAWLYVYGEMPSGYIDHMNGDRSDNRIENLREVTMSENLQNLRKPHKDTSSGFLGVSWDSRRLKWESSIRYDNRKCHLGYFLSPLDAHQAYLKAKRTFHSGCTI